MNLNISNTTEMYRQLRRRMVMNCLSPFDGIDVRTATSLISAGVLTSEIPRMAVEQEVANIVSSPDHPSRIAMLPGPMVGHTWRTDAPPSLEFPTTFFFCDQQSIRAGALRYFTHLRDVAPHTLSTRSVQLLTSLAERIVSDDRTLWMSAAIELTDCLDEDVLLNLAGIAQCVGIGFAKGIPDFIEAALCPSRQAVDSLQVPFPCPNAQSEGMAAKIEELAQSASSFADLCDKFVDQFGHVPFSPRYGLVAAVSAWKKRNADASVGGDLLEWATQHASCYARFHACSVFLAMPSEAQPAQWGDIASFIVDVIGSFGPEPAEDRSDVHWELRYDLAKHYLQYIEFMFPAQDERVASLAWWLADQFALSLGNDEAFLKSVRGRTIQQEEARSAHLWLLCRPIAQPNVLRYATLYLRSPWGYALLSGVTADSALALKSLADEKHLEKIGGAYIQCLLHPMFSFPPEQSNVTCGDATLICVAATELATQCSDLADVAALHGISKLGTRVIDLNEVFDAVRTIHEFEPEHQFLMFTALRTLVHSCPHAEGALWDVLQDRKWREEFLSRAPLTVLELLLDAVAQLSGIHERWRAFGPHFFAIGAMNSVNEARRRQALFALVLLSSLAAGTTSAVCRILRSKNRYAFSDDVQYWRERISQAVPGATPWMQGRLRAMLATLHMA